LHKLPSDVLCHRAIACKDNLELMMVWRLPRYRAILSLATKGVREKKRDEAKPYAYGALCLLYSFDGVDACSWQ
jgi:hypothetical protein